MPDDLLPAVVAAIERHRMLDPGDAVIAGFSGGPDSTALLHLLHRLREPLRLRLSAAHVDHGLRPDAAEDAAAAGRFCQSLGVPITVRRVDVAGLTRSDHLSRQMAARRARYAVFAELAAAENARIAVGHTANDQAETILMRFVRGTGLRGLTGIPPVRGAIIRPLLSVSRADIEAYCTHHQLPVRQDPSNASDAYLRNRVRRHLIPLIEREYNPRFRQAACRLASLLQADDAFLSQAAATAYARVAQATPGGPWYLPPEVPVDSEGSGGVEDEGRGEPGDGVAIRLDAPALLALPLALQRRAVLQALIDAGGDEAAVGAAEIDAVLGLAATEGAVAGGARPLLLPGPVAVRPESRRLWIERLDPADRPAPVSLATPGEARLPGSDLWIETRLVRASASARLPPPWIAVAWDGVTPPVTLRQRRPGDRLVWRKRPGEAAKPHKLKELLAAAGIVRWRRDRVPLLADSCGILWVAGVGAAEWTEPRPGTAEWLCFRFKRRLPAAL